MSSTDLISVRFKFLDRKFEVTISADEIVSTLKTIVKETLLKRTNIKKFGYNYTNLTIKNIVLQKASMSTLIDENYDNKTIRDIGVLDNEDFIVTLRQIDDAVHKQTHEEKGKEIESDFSKFSVYRKVIPGDNSCMFNAVNYALNQCLTESQAMRDLVAVEISNNPELYNEAVLETKPDDYCDWIRRSDTWGGGIELSILSKYFQIRIDVVDILNNTIEIIGDVNYFIYPLDVYSCYLPTLQWVSL